METLESFLVALIAALAPLIIQQIQQPSTAQDAFVDVPLEQELKNAITDPTSAAR